MSDARLENGIKEIDSKSFMMRKRFILAVLMLSFGLARAQTTVSPIYNFSNCVSAPLNIVRVTAVPLFPDTNFTGGYLSTYIPPFTRLNTPTLTNGFLIISNLVNCYAYSIDFYDGYVHTIITNYFPINATGRVNAVNWPYVQTNFAPQQLAYSQAQANALFLTTNGAGANGYVPVTSSSVAGGYVWQAQSGGGGTPALAGTNVYIVLVGGSNQFNVPTNSFDPPGAAAAVQAMIPSTNGFVTAAITNGFATTNFVITQGYLTNANGAKAALATNVVSGISITNAFITNSVFAGQLNLTTSPYVLKGGGGELLAVDSSANSFFGGNNPTTTTGGSNTGLGNGALTEDTTGGYNTAIGQQAMNNSVSGSFNTTLGWYTLGNLGNDFNGGSNNIAIGYNAGANYNANESSNIDIGSVGMVGENNIIHIGTGQTDTYLTGTIHGNGSGLTSISSNSVVSINPSQIYPLAFSGLNITTNATGPTGAQNWVADTNSGVTCLSSNTVGTNLALVVYGTSTFNGSSLWNGSPNFTFSATFNGSGGIYFGPSTQIKNIAAVGLSINTNLLASSLQTTNGVVDLGPGFTGNGAGLTNIPSSGISAIATNMLTLMSLLDFKNGQVNNYGFVATNASFTFTGPTNVNFAAINQLVVDVTNTAGGTINITLPAGIHGQGTFNCTNRTLVSFYCAWGLTNAIAYPIQ